MQNYSDKTLDKKEQEILSKYKLIKFKNDIKINTIEDVFKNLYVEPKDTYKLNNSFHCERWRGRSYYDAFLLCKYYLPDTTFKEMYKKLYALINTQNPNHRQDSLYFHQKPSFFTCPHIGKARFIGKLILD